ncbi:MAG: hypothetical protein FWE82_01090 [Defluviitaleaceae bacterium]|nr:hypothetical protein [Defluviitaleaceae bacterium]
MPVKKMIKWNKRVPQNLIARLYNSSAAGFCDDELADEAGWALYSRVESIISATNGFEKKCLLCPVCGKEVPLADEAFNCRCGFGATWDEFKRSYKGKQLHGANAMPVFLAFRRDFPKAKTFGEKLICIDVLIHSFHIKLSYYRDLPDVDPAHEAVELNRPACANLIEGKLSEVILFLDRLSSIEGYSQEKTRWRSIVERANGGEVLKSKD